MAYYCGEKNDKVQFEYLFEYSRPSLFNIMKARLSIKDVEGLSCFILFWFYYSTVLSTT